MRALRIRHGLRQIDLAAAAGLSQSIVSRVERGGGRRLTGAAMDQLAEALEARLIVRLDWNGEALDRLLDAGHADLVDQVTSMLRAAAWDVVPEATFSVGPERGSIDVLAWHAPSETLLIAEIKSVVPDLQSMLAALDRKCRLASAIAAPRGWRPRGLGRLLVIGDSRTSRRRVEGHAATFAARFPDRIGAIRRFIADPAANAGLAGLWFLSFRTGAPTRHRQRRRVAVSEHAPHRAHGLRPPEMRRGPI